MTNIYWWLFWTITLAQLEHHVQNLLYRCIRIYAWRRFVAHHGLYRSSIEISISMSFHGHLTWHARILWLKKKAHVPRLVRVADEQCQQFNCKNRIYQVLSIQGDCIDCALAARSRTCKCTRMCFSWAQTILLLFHSIYRMIQRRGIPLPLDWPMALAVTPTALIRPRRLHKDYQLKPKTMVNKSWLILNQQKLIYSSFR